MSISVLGVLFPNLNESKNSHIFWGGTNHQTPQINLEQTTLVRLHLRFARAILNLQQYFRNQIKRDIQK